jgi:hypothetical protein
MMKKFDPAKITRQLPTRGALNDLFQQPGGALPNINQYSKASPLTPDTALTASIQNLANPRREGG